MIAVYIVNKVQGFQGFENTISKDSSLPANISDITQGKKKTTKKKKTETLAQPPTRFFLIYVVINVNLSVDMTEEELGLTEHP